MAASLYRYILLAAALLITILLFTTNPPYVAKATSSASSLIHGHGTSPPPEKDDSMAYPPSPSWSQDEKATHPAAAGEEGKDTHSYPTIEHQISSISDSHVATPTYTVLVSAPPSGPKATVIPIVYASNSSEPRSNGTKSS